MSLTNQDKAIYNKFLATTRTAQNKPFKLRKDFKDFDDHKIACLKKLSLFFNKFSNVSYDDFFIAPWKLYDRDDNNFDLKFYTTPRALKVYTLYMQRKARQLPDSEEQLYDIKNSLKYILNFCNKHKLHISEYINHKTDNVYTFMEHLRMHKINIYTLFAFEEFEHNMSQVDREHARFMLGEIIDNIHVFRTNYITSSRAKILTKQGLNKIIHIQKKQLNNKYNTL